MLLNYNIFANGFTCSMPASPSLNQFPIWPKPRLIRFSMASRAEDAICKDGKSTRLPRPRLPGHAPGHEVAGGADGGHAAGWWTPTSATTVDSAPLELLNTFALARGRVTGP